MTVGTRVKRNVCGRSWEVRERRRGKERRVGLLYQSLYFAPGKVFQGFYETFEFFVPDWEVLKKELEYLFVVKN